MAGTESGHDPRSSMPTLRFHLSFGDVNWPVYWKPDGKRFASDPKGDKRPNDWVSLCSESTLKLISGRSYVLGLASNQPARLSEGSGRFCVREVDARGTIVETPLSPAPPAVAGPTNLPAAAQPGVLQPPAADSGPAPDSGPALDSGPAAAAWPQAGGVPLAWCDAGSDASRSAYRAEWVCSLGPTPSGRRQYLVVCAHVEDFGWIECPVQVKVYDKTDKNSRGSFSLRFIQYDFRGDSSNTAALTAVNYHRY